MANHKFKQFFYSLMNKPVKLAAVVTIDQTNGHTVLGRGFTSFAKTATGTYEITLDSKYSTLMGANLMLVSATARDRIYQVKQETVKTDGKLSILTLVAATATDLVDGDKLLVELLLSDSSSLS